MAIYEVLRFPDERLRTIAEPVEKVNSEVQEIVRDMFETMKDEKGIGLAATQVNIHKQIIVMDVTEDQSNPLVFINPQIVEHSADKKINEEGCLSVPGIYAEVERSADIKVRALDENGQQFELEASGLLAICIQHEMDHLNGKLFVDYLSPLKRQRIKTKLEKSAKRS